MFLVLKQNVTAKRMRIISSNHNANMVIKFNSHNSRGQLLHDLQQIFVDFCISRKTSKLKNIYHIDWINHWKQRAKKLSFELFSQKKKKKKKKNYKAFQDLPFDSKLIHFSINVSFSVCLSSWRYLISFFEWNNYFWGKKRKRNLQILQPAKFNQNH